MPALNTSKLFLSWLGMLEDSKQSTDSWTRKIFPASSPHFPNRMDDSEEDLQTRRLSPLFRRLLKIKVWLIERFRLSERQVTLIWAALIGFLGAIASECFRKASELLHFVATGSKLGII